MEPQERLRYVHILLETINAIVADASVPWKEKREFILKVNEEEGFDKVDGLGEFCSWFAREEE